jgi:hypothetical protein
VEFQNTGTTLTSFGIHEICQKSGHGVEWVNTGTKKAISLLGPEPVLPVPSLHGDPLVVAVLLEVCRHHRHHLRHLGHCLCLGDTAGRPNP